jgi:hypothetical protein
MAQKSFQCCSEIPAFQITYSVSGSEKDYLVCSDCIKKECFSKFILKQIPLENKTKNFQNEQSEINDESSVVSELYDDQTPQNEHNNERGGFVL